MRLKQRQKIIGVVTLVALLSFFVPEHFANAGWWDLPTFNDLIALFFQTIFGLIGGVIKVVSTALNYAVSVRAGGDIPVVKATWTILRDFSNMAFIILLIYMAFATIFDQGKYTFKDMIIRFLIVAILINFSLVIGILVIDACQVLTNIFLGSIGNIGDRLGQYLSPGQLLPSGAISATSLAGSGLVSLLFAVILSSILLFSMLTALIFAFIRVPFIWALLIVSPIAWMSHILPNTNKWWSQWWSLFLGWNLFLPVYLFFIYLGLLFLSKRNEIINSVIQVGTTTNPANTPLANTLTNGLTFNLVFFYFFAAVVMVGGTWAATKVTSMFGSGFEKGLGWAKGLVKSVPLPYIGNLSGAEAGAKARYGQFQQEGFKNQWLNKVYGGKEAQSRADAKAGSMFGVRDVAENQKSKDVGLWKEKIKNLSPAEWRNMMTNTKLPTYQRIAAAELLRDINQLSSAELISTYKLSGGDHSAMARKFLTDVDFGKLSEEERKAILNDKDIKDIRVRQKLAGIMAEKGDALGEKGVISDADALVKLARELYGPNNELGWREFLEKTKKKNLITYAEAMANMNLTSQEVQQEADGSDSKDSDGKPIKLTNPDGTKKLKSKDRFIAEQTSKMKIEDLGEQGAGTWKDENFKNALIERLNKAQKNDPRKEGKKHQIIPGAGERIIRDLKNKVKEDSSKIAVMHDIEDRFDVGEAVPSDDDFGGENDAGEESGEEGTPPTATGPTKPPKRTIGFAPPTSSGTGTVSYREADINTANVIDLRNNQDIEIK